MAFEVWVAFCVTEAVLCLTPGPAVLFVVSVAVSRGIRAGSAAALGIAAGNVFYFVLSATGIATVILASGALFEAIRAVGAGYLVWVGVRMLLAREADASAAPTPNQDRRAFLRAFVVQASNPKALVFFVALLPQFIDPAGSIAVQILVLGVSSVVLELVVLASYIALAARARRFAGGRVARPLAWIGGAVLVAAGARLACARGQ